MEWVCVWDKGFRNECLYHVQFINAQVIPNSEPRQVLEDINQLNNHSI